MNDSPNPPESPAEKLLEMDGPLIQQGFEDLEEAHRLAVQKARDQFGESAALGDGVRLTCAEESIPVPLAGLFSPSPESVIWEATQNIIGTLKEISLQTLEAHAPPLKDFNWSGYLMITAIRTLHLYRMLQRAGLKEGSLLEVGAYFGSFALPLQRLGYRVTVIDRYTDYADALKPACRLMQDSGVDIIHADRGNETEKLGRLGQFDGVLAMAVIEHIPHTPRLFLEGLKSHIRENGILALDTPNLTGYWNRLKMLKGESIFQDIRHQFYTEIPFEGHHREYTGDEILWMLGEIGLQDLILHYFDYNMFQFEALAEHHIECFLKMIEDPRQAGLIMALGRNSAPSHTGP